MDWKKISEKLANVLCEEFQEDLDNPDIGEFNGSILEDYLNYFDVSSKKFRKMLRGKHNWTFMQISKLEYLANKQLTFVPLKKRGKIK